MANLFTMGQGTKANYDALASKSQYEVYFCTDTHQIFLGAEEYTKGTKVLAAAPVDGTTVGDQDRLYAYDGALYLCTNAAAKTWIRVANISDTVGTVTSVAAGDGLETESGEAITESGTIKHSIPTGAAVTADDLADQTPAFGSTFAIKGVATDKFGHVTGINEHKVTIPTQTPVVVSPATATAQTLNEGDSFTVITGVARSEAAGATDHDLVATTTTFTLPSDVEVTYTISSVEEGVVTLTGSDASSSTAKISGWDDLAKKTELSSVFKYKGTVATVADLPVVAEVGDVYNVTTGSGTHTSTEYVCVTAGTAGGPAAQYEELGPVVDLSAYATTAYVDEKLTWHEF